MSTERTARSCGQQTKDCRVACQSRAVVAALQCKTGKKAAVACEQGCSTALQKMTRKKNQAPLPDLKTTPFLAAAVTAVGTNSRGLPLPVLPGPWSQHSGNRHLLPGHVGTTQNLQVCLECPCILPCFSGRLRFCGSEEGLVLWVQAWMPIRRRQLTID